MDEVQAVLKCGQGRQGSDQSPVEDARSLASAEDEDPQGRSWPARRQAVEFIPDGIAQADGLAPEERQALVEGHHGPFDPGGEHPVGEARPDVLLHDQGGFAQPGGRENDGAGAVAADADDQSRLEPEEEGQGFEKGAGQESQAADAFQAAPFETLDGHGDRADGVGGQDALLGGNR